MGITAGSPVSYIMAPARKARRNSQYPTDLAHHGSLDHRPGYAMECSTEATDMVLMRTTVVNGVWDLG